MNRKKITIKIFSIFIIGIIISCLILFLPAGSIMYWHAWLFIGTFFIPAFFVLIYFLKHDPKFLERRMKFKEKEIKQKTIIKIATLIFLAGFLIPGFDYRYGWSNIPTFLVILSDIIIFFGYLIILFVFKENRYASRIVVVEKGQKVITTGPYSVVRHPMYAGAILMYIFLPIALGSYWALFFFISIIPFIILRIFNEEEVLLRDLKGYREYMKKVKYRLIPGIW
ncbi:isoprenylcysteine carboxylmethyltransferase family protein [Patescibacteria group bacterium]|nr:isoprenylcysteine carboxylmethyltransferase family protein [Patescibacteria group bacterium]MBU1953577.1 isoprenylcysteine carboxylmethyltransferase family protein [Patescibacteria group bacterium]